MPEIVETTLKELLDAAGLPHAGIIRNDTAGQLIFAIQADDARALIGAHGDTVHALDHLVKKIVEQRLTAVLPDKAPAYAEASAARPISSSKAALIRLRVGLRWTGPREPLRDEDPFGDHTGYYTLPEPYPVFHITAITHRRRGFAGLLRFER